MKKIILASLIMMLILVSGLAYATENTDVEFDIISDKNVTDVISSNKEELNATTTSLKKEENVENLIEDDIYSIDENVKIESKQIQGNLYVIAEEIKIEDTIISGNIFLIGQNVNIKNSTIDGSAYIIAEDFESNSKIRDMYLLGDKLDMQEKFYIDRNAKILGTTTKIDGEINKNCYLVSDNIEILENAVIGGTLSYHSEKEADIKTDASIGNIDFHLQETETRSNVEQTITMADRIFEFVGAAIKAIVIAGVLVLLSNKKIERYKMLTVGDFFKALGIGTLILFGVPMLALILISSILGLGIGLIVLAIYVIMLYVSAVISCFVIASKLVKQESKWKVFGIAVLIYLAIRLISIFSGFGILASMILGLAGLGFLWQIIFYKEKKQEVITDNV